MESASTFQVKEKANKGAHTYKLLLVDKDAELYVARSDKRKTGRASIEVGGGRAIKFSLNTKDGKNNLTVADWETTPCRVNIARQTKDGYVAGYLGYNEKSDMCEFVARADAEAAGKMWLHFKLEKVKDESGGSFLRAPIDPKVKPAIFIRACIDSSDEDEYQYGL